MSVCRDALMSLYYYSTYVPRARRQRAALRTGRAPIAVVAFHRIADDRANNWTTPTSSFVQGMHWLRKNFDLVSLAEVQRRLVSGENRRPAVSITFDDGYAENSQVALPLLIELGIPCTYFVVTQSILEGACFAHDVIMGNRFPPNTIDQLRRISQAGIEIGAHTRTHADLGPVRSEATLHDEIVASRDELETAIGCKIRHFAFPFGRKPNLSPAAFRIAREAGYEGVCSCYGGYNTPDDDAFHLQRRGVDGPLIRLKNWALVDCFRTSRLERFDYQAAATCSSGVSCD